MDHFPSRAALTPTLECSRVSQVFPGPWPPPTPTRLGPNGTPPTKPRPLPLPTHPSLPRKHQPSHPQPPRSPQQQQHPLNPKHTPRKRGSRHGPITTPGSRNTTQKHTTISIRGQLQPRRTTLTPPTPPPKAMPARTCPRHKLTSTPRPRSCRSKHQRITRLLLVAITRKLSPLFPVIHMSGQFIQITLFLPKPNPAPHMLQITHMFKVSRKPR